MKQSPAQGVRSLSLTVRWRQFPPERNKSYAETKKRVGIGGPMSARPVPNSMRETIMAEETVNLSTIYLGVFSRAEQRVLQAIFKAIAEGGGRCVATLAMLARDSNTSKSTTRNAITRAVDMGLLERMERRFSSAVSLPSILTYGKSHAPARSLILGSPRRSGNTSLAPHSAPGGQGAAIA
jgi:hypothetical protein